LIGYYVYKEQLINGEPVSDQLQRAMVIHDPDKLHALIGGLEPNTEYGFRVNAYNRKGDGEFSSSKKIMTGGLLGLSHSGGNSNRI
uniref:Fibronectin type-III domain-containing protein n=1 Tax=Plectus sambesii TaxID=2011161 RepID=A0A914UWI4_9BILA